jgi:hypothetical protein
MRRHPVGRQWAIGKALFCQELSAARASAVRDDDLPCDERGVVGGEEAVAVRTRLGATQLTVTLCAARPAARTEVNATAARWAPCSVCSMPSTLVESSATADRPIAGARIPSCAGARSIGSARGPHIESTQCAIAFQSACHGHLAGGASPSG